MTGEEFLKQFPHYAERAVYLSDGCVDVSRAPDLYVNERAATDCSSPDDGELWRGGAASGAYLQTRRPARGPVLIQAFFPILVRRGKPMGRFLGGNPVSFAVFKQMPWNHYGVMALEETQLSMRSPYPG